MATEDDTVSKSQLARERGISPGRVSQYLREGMPMRSDGSLSRSACAAWIDTHVDPTRSAARRAALASTAAAVAPGARGLPKVAPPVPDTPRKVAQGLATAFLAQLDQVAALVVVTAGGSVELAWRTAGMLKLAQWEVMEGFLREAGLLRSSEGLVADTPIDPVWWANLAAEHGETFEPTAWEARLRAIAPGWYEP